MASSRAAALCLLCLVLVVAEGEAVKPATLRQLLQSGYFEPGVSGQGGWGGGGRRRGGVAAVAAACESSAESLLPDAEKQIQQAVAKAFKECTLVPCRPEASGVAPVIAEAVAPALVVASQDALFYSACSDEPGNVASQLASTYQQAVSGSCGSSAGNGAASSLSDLLASATQVVEASLYAYGEDLDAATSDLGDRLEDPIAKNLADALDACLEAAQAQAPAPEAEQAAAPAPTPEAEQAAAPAPAPEAPAPAPEAEQPLAGPFGVVALPTPAGLPPAPEMPAVDAVTIQAPRFGPQPTPAPAPEPEVPSFATIPAPEPVIAPASNATNAIRSAAAGPIAGMLQERLAAGSP